MTCGSTVTYTLAHELLDETNRDQVTADIIDWIKST